MCSHYECSLCWEIVVIADPCQRLGVTCIAPVTQLDDINVIGYPEVVKTNRQYKERPFPNYIDQLYQFNPSHCDLQGFGNDAQKIGSMITVAGAIVAVGSAALTPIQPEFAAGIQPGVALANTGSVISLVGAGASALGGDFGGLFGEGLGGALGRFKILNPAQGAAWDALSNDLGNRFADTIGAKVIQCR